jgi:hypothetical protein
MSLITFNSVQTVLKNQSIRYNNFQINKRSYAENLSPIRITFGTRHKKINKHKHALIEKCTGNVSVYP